MDGNSSPHNRPAHARHLEDLRRWRNPAPRDLTLGKLPGYVESQYAKPHGQVGQLAGIWGELIPEPLAARTALASFSRGVLTVHVADSPALYELDRLLRGGVERRIQRASRAGLRRIKLRVGGDF